MQYFYRRGEVGSAVSAIQHQYLASALGAAVERVRLEAGVSRETVMLLLPEKEMHDAVTATAGPQERAFAVAHQHEQSIGALLGRGARLVGTLLEYTWGTRGAGIDRFFGDVFGMANSALKDSRLKEPLETLTAALRQYDEWLKWAESTLDGDIALNEARDKATRRRQWKRIAISVGTAAVIGGGGFGVYRATLAMDPPTLPITVATTEAPVASQALGPLTSGAPLTSKPPAPPARAATRPGAGRPALATPAAPAASTAVQATAAPRSRGDCLRSCVTSCNDDSNCERSCASTCPR
jgi:hypothetical protein